MVRFNAELVSIFYQDHANKPYFPQIVQTMTSDVVIGIEILGDNAIEAVTRLAGPTNPAAAKQQAPQSWRARFGSQGAANAVHVSGD